MTQYYPSTIRYVFDPDKGLIQEIAETSTVTFASGTIVEVSGVFAYVPEDPSQWSTVPTNLIQAIDYLAAGSGSGGGGGGGGAPGGSNGDIQYKVNATTFGGVNKIRFVGGNVFVTGSFLGDVVGTASYATNATSALTASYVLNAVSSSFASSALTASYILNAVSASFATNATNALTASYVLNAISSSFASNALTASYVLNAVSSSFATNALTASYVLNAVSASFATSSTSALTASYVLNAVSASFASSALTASFVQNAVSSSFATSALTASYVLNAVSSSFASTALSASYAANADLLDNLDSTAFARLSVGNTFTSNQVVSGTVTSTLGFSGSLTKLADGTSYIKAGSNITVTTASNGSITIASTGGGGTIGGSIAANQVAYGTAANTISGSGNMTYVSGTLISDNGTSYALKTTGQIGVNNVLGEEVVEFEPELYSFNVRTGPSLDPGTAYTTIVEAGQITVTDATDSTFSTTIATSNLGSNYLKFTDVAGGILATISASDASGNPAELHISASSITMGTPAGTGNFLEIDSGLQQIKVSEKASNVDSVTIVGGQVNVDSGAGIGGVGLTIDTLSGIPTINSIGGGGSPTTLNLSIAELQINTAPGSSGQVLTSQGAGSAPIWSTPVASAVSGSSINVVYVAKNGSNSSVSGSINSPFLTIQGAINYIESKRPSVFANDQDVVIAVAPGVYSEDITFTKPFINVMGYVPTQYSKATQLRGLVNVNNTSDPGGGTGQIFGLYNFLITPPTTASANVVSFSGTGNGSLILENMQVVGGGSNQSILYVSKSAAVATNCRVKARHSIFNLETAGSAGPTANIFNVYSVFESCEIGYSGSVAGGTVFNANNAVVEFYRGTLTAATSNSIIAKITGSIASPVTVGDTAIVGSPGATEINGFLLTAGSYYIGGKNAYSLPASATKFVVSGAATSVFITAFDGIIPGGAYNTKISNTMTTTFASASFTKVT